MYIENARICDVTIVPTSDVTIVPTRYGMELELKLAVQEGYYTKTFNMATPIEDLATLCDVVGVQSYGDLIGARIRVLVPDYGYCQIIGNATDNKWLNLEHFNRMILQPGVGLLYTGDKKGRIRVKIDREVKDINIFNARIVDTFLGIEDSGIFTFSISVEIAGIGGCTIGNYCLSYTKDGKMHYDAKNSEAICRVLKVVGVDSWGKLKGQYIRVEYNGLDAGIHTIGNLMKDEWFNFEEFFSDGTTDT